MASEWLGDEEEARLHCPADATGGFFEMWKKQNLDLIRRAKAEGRREMRGRAYAVCVDVKVAYGEDPPRPLAQAGASICASRIRALPIGNEPTEDTDER